MDLRIDPEWESLCLWAQRYEIINQKRLLPTFMLLKAALNQTSVSVVGVAKLVLWIFAIDDMVDDPKRKLADIKQRIVAYKKVFFCDRLDFEDQYILILFELLEPIRRDALKDKFALFYKMVYMMLESMIIERQQGGQLKNELKISTKSYLMRGVYSIGSPAFLSYCDLLSGLSEFNFDKRLHLLCLSAVIIRLANDFQSYDREISECGMNICFISDMDKSTVLKLATQQWSRFKEHYASFLDDEIVRITWNTTLYTLGFYTSFDFHNTDEHNLFDFFDRIKMHPDFR